MMKNQKLTFTFLFILCSFATFGQTQNWIWAKCAGGNSDNYIYDITTDNDGNVYVTGFFNWDTLTLGGIILKSNGYEDVFIAKYDSSGKVIWAKNMGGHSQDLGKSIVSDKNGYIYLSGYYYSDSITFDNIVLKNPNYPNWNAAIFLAKLDRNGNTVWAQTFSGDFHDQVNRLAIDNFANLYITGYFQSKTLAFGSDTLINSGKGGSRIDIFIAKFDSSGNTLWAMNPKGNLYGNEFSNYITISPAGFVYITGSYEDSITFGKHMLTSGNNGSMFIAKLDSSGYSVWLKAEVGRGGTYATCLAVDSKENVFISGSFALSKLIFDNITLTNSYQGGYNRLEYFIAKLDSSGTAKWAKSAGNSWHDQGMGLTVDAHDNIYAAGRYDDTITFGSFKITGRLAMFIVKYDLNGNEIWVKTTGGNRYETAHAITTGSFGNIYVAGRFDSDTLIIGNDSLIKTGFHFNYYIAKIETATPCLYFITYSTDTIITCNTYTSPSGKYVWTTSGVYQDTIQNAAGCDSMISIRLIIGKSNSDTIHVNTCSDFTSPSGKYLWKTSGTYKDTIQNAVGCDSIITIHLTIGKSSAGSIHAHTCLDFTSPSGKYLWKTSGIYKDTIQNHDGCDSIMSINLTIGKSSAGSIHAHTCLDFTSPSGKYLWKTSGIYKDTIQNHDGCDSIMSINLTIGKSSAGSIYANTCSEFTSPSGKYLWKTSGTYKDTIQNHDGCDSIVTITLTINKPTSSSISTTGCNSFVSPSGKYTWDQSGIYTDTIQNSRACDSVILIDLSINSIDTSVIHSGDTLIANVAGVSYQWLDCNKDYAIIVGADSKKFVPVNKGYFAVEVSDTNCVDTSVCYSLQGIGIFENTFGNDLRIYPNPTSGKISIDLGEIYLEVDISVSNFLGQEILVNKYKESDLINFTIDGSAGFYFIEIHTTDGKSALLKVLKE